MNQALHWKRFTLFLISLCLAGCQAIPHTGTRDFSGTLVSVYRTPLDAQAVQAGNLGVVPVALVRARELKSVAAA